MRWIIAFFAFTLAAMQLELWSGDDRLIAVQRLERSVAEQSAINQALIQENADLEAEVRDLKRKGDGEAIEERARSELGLTFPGEGFYQFAKVDP